MVTSSGFHEQEESKRALALCFASSAQGLSPRDTCVLAPGTGASHREAGVCGVKSCKCVLVSVHLQCECGMHLDMNASHM